ncbi:sodium/proton antiporter (NhaA family) [Actinomycetospora succinea]|uniref:Na(+)/H(+) antiporter NhaA n=1 Tax=Actinomycetospora succinea TaxID=663603 RepID=A0A4R6UMD9_9PSEU|nr:Na+/H+ antiporter NhaA [Actinomycetospora succinea]TDQ47356.1 sodium/proton antiporter (NhaA family) [Actinomycetospora succinea]
MADVTDSRPRWHGVLERISQARRGDASESLAAVFMLGATVLALLWANSPWGSTYDAFWHTPLAISLGDWSIDLDLQHWVNDGLMALFFFVIGLEVKREFALGELRDRSKAAVPLTAAVAGLALPAVLFLLLNPSGPAASAWGVVISTDTAFLLGALAVIGPGRAERLRIFLLTLAVADDVGALAIIALVYTDEVHVVPLIVSIVGLLIIWQLRRLRVWRGGGYLVVSLVTWLALYESGVHATLAGVLIALLLPVYPPKRKEVERAAALARAFRQSPNPEYARSARLGLERAVSVNERLMRLWQPYTAFIIVPVFALANAGVPLTAETLRAAIVSPLFWGIVLGLVVGKFVGITGATAVLARLRPGSLAPGLTMPQIAGGAALSGIGFTISLFIVDLALDDEVLADTARVGVLAGSVIALGLGAVVFRAGRSFLPEEPSRDLLRPVDPRRDHIRGPVGAPLTIVEYGDFECPFCGKATGNIRQVREHFGDDMRYVFRHLPLDDVHPHARSAAEIAEAAARQDRFWDVHDTFFAHADALERDDLIAYCADLGLDIDRLEEDLREGDPENHVEDDEIDARSSDLPGTPTFYLAAGDAVPQRHVGPYDAKTLIGELERMRASSGNVADPR